MLHLDSSDRLGMDTVSGRQVSTPSKRSVPLSWFSAWAERRQELADLSVQRRQRLQGRMPILALAAWLLLLVLRD